MPYIITTFNASIREPLNESRRAVATLEEARRAVYEAHRAADPTTGMPERNRIAGSITESGGMVGPLPDGTVIEVAHWHSCALASWVEDDRAIARSMTDEQIVDAYNARAER